MIKLYKIKFKLGQEIKACEIHAFSISHAREKCIREYAKFQRVKILEIK